MVKCVTQTIEKETKRTKGEIFQYFSMLLGTLVALQSYCEIYYQTKEQSELAMQ